MAEEGKNEEIELDESLIYEQETPEEPEPVKASEPEKEEDDVPPKYRGKTAMEIIRMHQDAERLIGKQGNEVGELRKIVDDIVSKVNAQPSDAPKPDDTLDFFENPKAATARVAREALESDPDLKKIKTSVVEMERQAAAQQLLRRHPDAAQLANDPAFGNWVGKSQLRQKLFLQAHNEYDYEAAAELFDMFKETKAYNSGVEKAGKAQRNKDLQKASTGSGKVSSEVRGKPTLSREAIVNLRIKDPERYEQLLPELKRAYAEGRVR